MTCNDIFSLSGGQEYMFISISLANRMMHTLCDSRRYHCMYTRGSFLQFQLKIQSLIWLLCSDVWETEYTCKVKLYTVLYDTAGLTSAGKWNTRQLMLSFWGWQRSANCCIYNEFEVQMFRVLPQGLTKNNSLTTSALQTHKLNSNVLGPILFIIAVRIWGKYDSNRRHTVTECEGIL